VAHKTEGGAGVYSRTSTLVVPALFNVITAIALLLRAMPNESNVVKKKGK
jgi:hypothetical protein